MLFVLTINEALFIGPIKLAGLAMPVFPVVSHAALEEVIVVGIDVTISKLPFELKLSEVIVHAGPVGPVIPVVPVAPLIPCIPCNH